MSLWRSLRGPPGEWYRSNAGPIVGAPGDIRVRGRRAVVVARTGARCAELLFDLVRCAEASAYNSCVVIVDSEVGDSTRMSRAGSFYSIPDSVNAEREPDRPLFLRGLAQAPCFLQSLGSARPCIWLIPASEPAQRVFTVLLRRPVPAPVRLFYLHSSPESFRGTVRTLKRLKVGGAFLGRASSIASSVHLYACEPSPPVEVERLLKSSPGSPTSDVARVLRRPPMTRPQGGATWVRAALEQIMKVPDPRSFGESEDEGSAACDTGDVFPKSVCAQLSSRGLRLVARVPGSPETSDCLWRKGQHVYVSVGVGVVNVKAIRFFLECCPPRETSRDEKFGDLLPCLTYFVTGSSAAVVRPCPGRCGTLRGLFPKEGDEAVQLLQTVLTGGDVRARLGAGGLSAWVARRIPGEPEVELQVNEFLRESYAFLPVVCVRASTAAHLAWTCTGCGRRETRKGVDFCGFADANSGALRCGHLYHCYCLSAAKDPFCFCHRYRVDGLSRVDPLEVAGLLQGVVEALQAAQSPQAHPTYSLHRWGGVKERVHGPMPDVFHPALLEGEEIKRKEECAATDSGRSQPPCAAAAHLLALNRLLPQHFHLSDRGKVLVDIYGCLLQCSQPDTMDAGSGSVGDMSSSSSSGTRGSEHTSIRDTLFSLVMYVLVGAETEDEAWKGFETISTHCPLLADWIATILPHVPPPPAFFLSPAKSATGSAAGVPVTAHLSTPATTASATPPTPSSPGELSPRRREGARGAPDVSPDRGKARLHANISDDIPEVEKPINLAHELPGDFLNGCVRHPYFWSAGEKVKFLAEMYKLTRLDDCAGAHDVREWCDTRPVDGPNAYLPSLADWLQYDKDSPGAQSLRAMLRFVYKMERHWEKFSRNVAASDARELLCEFVPGAKMTAAVSSSAQGQEEEFTESDGNSGAESPVVGIGRASVPEMAAKALRAEMTDCTDRISSRSCRGPRCASVSAAPVIWVSGAEEEELYLLRKYLRKHKYQIIHRQLERVDCRLLLQLYRLASQTDSIRQHIYDTPELGSIFCSFSNFNYQGIHQ